MTNRRRLLQAAGATVGAAALSGAPCPRQATNAASRIFSFYPPMCETLCGKAKERGKPLMRQWRYRVFGGMLHHSTMLQMYDGTWRVLINPDRVCAEHQDMSKDPSE